MFVKEANLKVLVVIVLYNESLLESKTYNTLLCDSIDYDEIFIYDNSPVKQEVPSLSKKYQYIHYPDNPGLSKVYNEAANYAATKGIDWLLLLDQDTSFPKGAWSSYLQAVEKFPYIKMFTPRHIIKSGRFISPVPYIYRFACSKTFVPIGIASFEKFIPINSGMLVNVQAFIEVGGYNEAVTLDFSDTQFVERFTSKYKEFYILDCICSQDFSAETTNFTSLLNRFEIFCKCARNCQKNRLVDKIQYFLVVLKRTISLSVKCKKVVFLRYFFKYYL
ncbi:glycosyltransferase [Dysgonomonas capnocytophagoides]|uniref:glycosyltransferase n=1 Tax=Dysgonomonas capnocytophagoides TaxID=45254 RepID=UPI002922FDF9|nr:hypothetical protein DCPSUM001_26520 [Dysgonomonas capnocytophagoides]